MSLLLEKHRKQPVAANLLSTFSWTRLNLLSQHKESYAQFISSLEATMDNIANQCKDFDPEGDAPLLTEDWTTAWGFMCLTAGEVAQHMIVDLNRIAQEETASKPELLTILSWLQRIQRVHDRMALLIESLPVSATAEMGYLVDDQILASVDDLTRQLNTAAAKFTIRSLNR